ncbi:MAG: hypothetical protein CMF70_06810 [Magnetovibrio sp.]|nr:hypothetical protein [Magnetovibrio sp.]|tara:strand:+ start:2637 stop:3032 length:396 start_codon:yes stop_codon:yes gene_type:complete
MKHSEAWKALERLAAKELGGTRITRGHNFAVSEPDVYIADFEHLKVDCKRRKQSFTHHTMLQGIKDKYCVSHDDVPVLITRNHGERGAVMSLYLKDGGALLNNIRTLTKILDGIEKHDVAHVPAKGLKEGR